MFRRAAESGLRGIMELEHDRLHSLPLLVRASRESQSTPTRQRGAQGGEMFDRVPSKTPTRRVRMQVSKPPQASCKARARAGGQDSKRLRSGTDSNPGSQFVRQNRAGNRLRLAVIIRAQPYPMTNQPPL